MEYVKRLNPRPEKVITCHGDPYKAVDLASSIHRSYKIETKTPINLDCVRIQWFKKRIKYLIKQNYYCIENIVKYNIYLFFN